MSPNQGGGAGLEVGGLWFEHLGQLPHAEGAQTAWRPGSGWELPAVQSQSAFLYKRLFSYCSTGSPTLMVSLALL